MVLYAKNVLSVDAVVLQGFGEHMAKECSVRHAKIFCLSNNER